MRRKYTMLTLDKFWRTVSRDFGHDSVRRQPTESQGQRISLCNDQHIKITSKVRVMYMQTSASRQERPTLRLVYSMNQPIEATSLNSTWPQHIYHNVEQVQHTPNEAEHEAEYIAPIPTDEEPPSRVYSRRMRESMIIVNEMKDQTTSKTEKLNLNKLKRMVDDCLADEEDCVKQLEKLRSTHIKSLTDIERTLQKLRRNADSTEKHQGKSIRLPKCLRK